MYPIFALFISALFMFYKYVLQVFPSTITYELMTKYNISGALLGHLSACYFYSYLVVQIFAGFIIDIFPRRFIISIAIFICSVSLAVFAITDNFTIAQLSRAGMGVGVAFATANYFKTAGVLFHRSKFSILAGIMGAAAMLGAGFGSSICQIISEKVGWQNSLLAFALIGAILSFIFLFTIKNESSKVDNNISECLKVFKIKSNWLLSFYGALAFSSFHVISGLWGIPFIQASYNLSATDSALVISYIFLGFIVSSPMLCWMAEKYNTKFTIMSYGSLIAAAVLFIIIYMQSLIDNTSLKILLFTFGFCAGSFVLAPAVAKEYTPKEVVATMVTMLNLVEALWTGLSEFFTGKLLDIGDHEYTGVKVFMKVDYQRSLSILIVYLLASIVFIQILKINFYAKQSFKL